MKRSLLSQRYVPLRKLSEGSLSEVFLARQTGLLGFQREVILKVFNRRLSSTARAVELLLEEARLAAILNHPNIVRIHDVGEEEGSYFIVMERIPGASLRTLVQAASRQGELIPLEMALNILIQVLEGLRYAHTFRDETGRHLHLVHRDLCPDNVLLAADGTVKIIDFGIARVAQQLREEIGLGVVKYAYMSPELIRSEMLDARSDLFSAGILLYELTVGQRLFRGASYKSMLRLLEEPIPPPTFALPGYPVDLEIVVMRALERNPADRFTSAEEMLEELERFAFDSGVRISRLRLGRYFARVVGVTESALEATEAAPVEALVEGAAEDLDFDRELFESISGVFVQPTPSGEEAAITRVHEQPPAVGETTVKIVAERGGRIEDDTARIPRREQAALQKQTEPSGPREVTMVVSAEQVEEELELEGSADDLMREPALVERITEPELELEAPAPDAGVVAAGQRSPTAPPLARPSSEPSAALREALADISAEIRAAEEEDRRRVDALAHTIERLTGEPIDGGPEEEAAPSPSGIAAPPAVQPGGASSSADELERTDGEQGRGPDELELADLTSAPPTATGAGVAPELVAEGETIVIEPESSAVEVLQGAEGWPSPPPLPDLDPVKERSGEAPAAVPVVPADATTRRLAAVVVGAAPASDRCRGPLVPHRVRSRRGARAGGGRRATGSRRRGVSTGGRRGGGSGQRHGSSRDRRGAGAAPGRRRRR